MTVVMNENGTYDVVENGEDIKTGFATSEAAWQWIDRHNDDGIKDENRRRKIRTNFTNKYF